MGRSNFKRLYLRRAFSANNRVRPTVGSSLTSTSSAGSSDRPALARKSASRARSASASDQLVVGRIDFQHQFAGSYEIADIVMNLEHASRHLRGPARVISSRPKKVPTIWTVRNLDGTFDDGRDRDGDRPWTQARLWLDRLLVGAGMFGAAGKYHCQRAYAPSQVSGARVDRERGRSGTKVESMTVPEW